MDLQKNRLPIALGFLVILGAGTVLALQRRDQPPPEAAEVEGSLPEIDRDAITALEITRPGAETIRLEREGENWRVKAPVDSEVEPSTINGALDKLSSLEVRSVAATRAENHETLQVDPSNGVRVVAHAADGVLLDLWVGALRSANTMARLEGSDTVYSVRGSMKYAFDKDLKEWRNRRILEEEPGQIRAIAFQMGEDTLRFERGDDDTWAQAEGEAPIERFSAAKVQSLVSSLARMRASDFAAPSIDEASAGLTEPVSVVTLTVAEPSAPSEGGEEGEPAEAAPAAATKTIVLRVGGNPEGAEGAYVRHDDRGDVIYTVSRFLLERLRPEVTLFQAPEPGTEEAEEAPPEMHGPGGGGQEIPPELMQQIQRQLQQQQGS